MMKKSILVGLLSLSVLSAQSDVSVYGGGIDYSSSIKDDGLFAGIYFQNTSEKNKFELNYERTEISYDSSTLIGDLEQNDFTAVWTHYLNNNYLFRVGGHYIDSNDKYTDEGYTAFAGVKYYQGYDFDMGFDAYYSDYKNYILADGSKGLSIIQLEPSIGFSFGNYQSTFGSFYLKTFYTYINPDEGKNGLLRDDYHSGGLQLKQFIGKWTNEAGGWVGKQVFGVRNGGFTVFNLAEERKGGFNLSSQYAFNKNTSIKLQYSYEKFDEASINSSGLSVTTDASTNVLSLLLNYSF